MIVSNIEAINLSVKDVSLLVLLLLVIFLNISIIMVAELTKNDNMKIIE